MESAFGGQKLQPGHADLKHLSEQVRKGSKWQEIFPGVAALDLSSQGAGPSLNLRLTKKEGIPVTLVPEGTPDAAVVAVKRVDELGFYNLGLRELADHVGLSQPKVLAIIKHMRLQEDVDCFKAFKITTQPIKRYSQNAIKRIGDALPTLDVDEIWEANKPPGRGTKKMQGKAAAPKRDVLGKKVA